MTERREFYVLLGVEADATSEQIHRAYRKLAFRLHPDRSDAPDASERFARLGEAHEVLMDEEARAAYDATGEVPIMGDALDRAAQREVVQVLRNTLDQWFQQDALDLTSQPFVDNLRAAFDRMPEQMANNIAALDKCIAKMRALRDRLHHQGQSSDFMGAELDRLLDDYHRRKKLIEAHLPVVARARRLLDDYTFDQLLRMQHTVTVVVGSSGIAPGSSGTTPGSSGTVSGSSGTGFFWRTV